MSERGCTYVGCMECGVGAMSETSSHWLCAEHLKALQTATDDYYTSGGIDRLKKMVGMTVRAGGGAKAMTERMAPSIKAGAAMIAALSQKAKPPA